MIIHLLIRSRGLAEGMIRHLVHPLFFCLKIWLYTFVMSSVLFLRMTSRTKASKLSGSIEKIESLTLKTCRKLKKQDCLCNIIVDGLLVPNLNAWSSLFNLVDLKSGHKQRFIGDI